MKNLIVWLCKCGVLHEFLFILEESHRGTSELLSDTIDRIEDEVDLFQLVINESPYPDEWADYKKRYENWLKTR